MWLLFFPHHLQLSHIPPGVRGIDFWFSLTLPDTGLLRNIIYYTRVTNISRSFQYTISGLELNKTYSVDLRAEGEYEWCSYNEIVGNRTERFVIKTSDESMTA